MNLEERIERASQRTTGLCVDSMLDTARAVLEALLAYYKELKPGSIFTILDMETALRNIPADIEAVRRLDAERRD